MLNSKLFLKKKHTEKQTLKYGGQTDGYQRGGRWGNEWNYVMGINECTSCDEHWVMYRGVESLYCISETNKLIKYC